MNMICLGELILNLDHMVDAEWVTRQNRDTGAAATTLQLRFDCPSPVPTTAGFVTGPLVVNVPSGPNADAAWSAILNLCVPPIQIGDLKGRVVSS